jgi:hypothetical protein
MRLSASPTERTTAATDIVLSLTAASGAVLLQSLQSPNPWKTLVWSWAFALIAMAAALGGAYHGLVLSAGKRTLLWRILTVGLSLAISLVAVGVVHDVLGLAAARSGLPFLLMTGLLVFAVSRVFPGLFVVFIVYQALALVLALSAYAWMATQGTPAGAGWMAAGAAVSLIAAGVQSNRRLNIRMVWEFDRNGVYHLVQTLGVVLFCVGLLRG